MKKYMIPIGMVAGALLGVVIGLIAHFALQIFVCAGAACGIVVGAILQLVWNQKLPDTYFEKKQKKTDMDASLFAEDEVALREKKTEGHMFHEKNVEEEEEDDTEEDEEALAEERAELARRAAQRKEWEALQARRKQEAQRAHSPSAPQQRATSQQRPASPQRTAQPQARPTAQQRPVAESSKRRVIIEEDDD